jgi:excisionase family DNA binding protein
MATSKIKLVDPIDDTRIALTMRECARALGVSERAVWSLVKSGRLPSFRLGRTVRISRNAIEAFIEQGGAS